MSWLHRILGKDGASQLGIEPKHFAAKVTGRPMEVGTRGCYSMGATTGIIAAGLAANSEIFQFRWADASRIALIRSVIVSAAVSTTAFVAGVPPTLELRVARSWSAAGSGGTRITLTGNDAKKRTDFASSLVAASDIGVSTTGALTGGTKTLDGVPFAVAIGNTGVATGTTQMFPPGTVLWQRNTHEEYPLLLEQNEGFVVRAVQVPGTGTWTATVNVEWAELDPAAIEGWT